MNPTYKTLETRLRVAGLTIGQWAQLVASAGLAILFGTQLSPFSTGPTFTISVLLAGLPLAVSYGLDGSEFSATGLIAAVWRWFRRPRRYTGGPGGRAIGYVVVPLEPEPELRPSMNGREIDLEAAWDA